MAGRLQQAVEYDERRNGLRSWSSVAAADSESENDVASEPEDASPFTPDVDEAGAEEDAKDRKESKDYLPDSDGADGVSGDEGVDCY